MTNMHGSERATFFYNENEYDAERNTYFCPQSQTGIGITAMMQTNKQIKEKQTADRRRTILGIDPGTNLLGYGVLAVENRNVRMQAMGVIDLRKCTDVYLKLGRIYERVYGVIESFSPDAVAIESPFFGKNVQSMLKLGRAQGVAIAAAICQGMPIHEYAPLKIKQAITGQGSADKQQVAAVLQKILHIPSAKMLPYADATDALAAAYCHYLQTASPLGLSLSLSHRSAGTSSWKSFVQTHADRIAKRPVVRESDNL